MLFIRRFALAVIAKCDTANLLTALFLEDDMLEKDGVTEEVIAAAILFTCLPHKNLSLWHNDSIWDIYTPPPPGLAMGKDLVTRYVHDMWRIDPTNFSYESLLALQNEVRQALYYATFELASMVNRGLYEDLVTTLASMQSLPHLP